MSKPSPSTPFCIYFFLGRAAWGQGRGIGRSCNLAQPPYPPTITVNPRKEGRCQGGEEGRRRFQSQSRSRLRNTQKCPCNYYIKHLEHHSKNEWIDGCQKIARHAHINNNVLELWGRLPRNCSSRIRYPVPAPDTSSAIWRRVRTDTSLNFFAFARIRTRWSTNVILIPIQIWPPLIEWFRNRWSEGDSSKLYNDSPTVNSIPSNLRFWTEFLNHTAAWRLHDNIKCRTYSVLQLDVDSYIGYPA